MPKTNTKHSVQAAKATANFSIYGNFADSPPNLEYGSSPSFLFLCGIYPLKIAFDSILVLIVLVTVQGILVREVSIVSTQVFASLPLS